MLRRALADHDITTVQYRGWDGIKNGELLKLVAAEFDVFVTSDKNLRYQQDLAALGIAVIILPTNQVPAVRALLPRIDEVLRSVERGELIEIDG